MKKVRAIAFDNAKEIDSLVNILKQHINPEFTTTTKRMHELKNQARNLLKTALEIQRMFISSNKEKSNG